MKSFFGFSVSILSLVSTLQPAPAFGYGQYIELTRADFFASRDWDVRQVSVFGLHLGMTREAASSILLSRALRLVTGIDYRACGRGDRCKVCGQRNRCPGVSIVFGGDDQIASIDVERIPEDAESQVRRQALQRQLRGNTYLLFNNYSDELRIRILGHERSREVLSDKNPAFKGKIRYQYPDRGLSLYVSANPAGQARTSDIVLTFTTPMK